MTIGDEPLPAQTGGPSVFLSYARDDRPTAIKVVAALEAKGCTVWWDGLLEGGVAFANQTEEALESADAVVVLWSATSIKSHWVRDEATQGRDGARLVPVSIDGAQAPLGFRQFQLLDLTHWKGSADAPEIADLIRAIGIASGGSAPARPVLTPSVPVNRRRAMMIGGGVAAVAAAGGIGAWQLGLFGAPAAAANSVAVIPFKNLSSDAEQGYFSDGLSEEIRLALSRNSALRVIAPASAKAAGEDSAPTDAAKKLDVAFLLQGSVRSGGDMMRITAELINAKTGTADWSDRFDRPRGDVFAVQGEIADAVASALSAQVAGNSKAGGLKADSGPGGTSSVRAYDAYLRGNAYFELRTGEASARSALAQYEAALAIDPDFALALAARARIVTTLTNFYARADQFKVQYDEAIKAARRAVEIAPDVAITQSTLGFVLMQAKLDLRGARAPFERARKLGAGDARVQILFAAYCAIMGRQADAQIAIARAIELDPINPAVFRQQSVVHYCGRRFEDAVGSCRRALSINPKLATVHAYLGDSLFQLGKVAEARNAYLAEPGELLRLTGLAIVDQKAGNTAAASASLDQLKAKFGEGSAYQQAQISAQWGNTEAALAQLLLAERIGDIGLTLAKVDPLLDPLRATPEFSRLLNRLGFV